MAIKVLIAEDDDNKARLLESELIALGVSQQNIITVTNAAETRQALVEHAHTINLMLLDLALPNRGKDTPHASVGLEILRMIVVDGEYVSPDTIVGTTADSEVLIEYENRFRDNLTQILFVAPDVSQWKASLRSLILRIKSSQDAPRDHKVDVCFVTALRKPELAAVLKLPIVWGAEQSLGNGVLIQEGTSEINGKVRTFICAHSNQMGMVAASFMMRVIWERYFPKLVFMTGICGGLKDSALGDVIIAERSWDWQSGKVLHDGSFESAPDQKEGNPELVALARGMEASAVEFWTSQESRPSKKPVLHVGPMVSGSSVVEDVALHDRFFSQHRKAIGVDMECYGLYFTTQMSVMPASQALCIKCVSDLADRAKSDNYQEYCSQLSANIAFGIVNRFFIS
ncbi:hypothetical protein [Pseudomonas piscis]|uniref:phosphorylase family protein n=1 Tax=Pseudomonas piscis TaxID=2614538 RepID=UPI0021D59A08|nr:hypothetical protein [Pseudomonas piscis]